MFDGIWNDKIVIHIFKYKVKDDDFIPKKKKKRGMTKERNTREPFCTCLFNFDSLIKLILILMIKDFFLKQKLLKKFTKLYYEHTIHPSLQIPYSNYVLNPPKKKKLKKRASHSPINIRHVIKLTPKKKIIFLCLE